MCHCVSGQQLSDIERMGLDSLIFFWLSYRDRLTEIVMLEGDR